ncbi:anthrone oxygenase family protein [Solicola sp. PLA-1-18]|uniref:anthrone oxygenase family protein n=1 Tax=Solicola sp. PLA-1-18 TaxID=3380532 RepID=UPI003B7BCB7A
MTDLWRLLTAATTIGTAASGGALLTYSTFTTTGLARLPASQGMAAMQQLNLAAPRSAGFMTVLFLPAALTVALAVHALATRPGGAWLVVTATAVHVVGVVGVTVLFHVPRNDALASMDPVADAARFGPWLEAWVAGNHVRTASGLLSSVLLALSLR